jgi:hypothetical protein
MPRPSLVTSSGPSPVRGFIAAIYVPLPYSSVLLGNPAPSKSRNQTAAAKILRPAATCLANLKPATYISISPSIIQCSAPVW